MELISLSVLMDFCYLVQLTQIDDCEIECISTALAEFHTNKQAIIDAGFHQGKGDKVIDNWYIPKIELTQSIIPSICNTGVAMQWTADTMKHVHVTDIKDPTQSSNNNNYDAQICRHLDHADKCCHFELAMSLLDLLNQYTYLDEYDDNIDLDVHNDHNHPVDLLATTSSPGTIPGHFHFYLAYDLSIRTLSVNDTALKFNLPDLWPALADFLHHEDTYGNNHIYTIGGARRAGHNALLPFDKLQIWFKPTQTLNCAPPCDLWTSGQYDTVIVNHKGGYLWPTDGLHDCFLTYVEQFDIGDCEPNTQLYLLKRVKQSNGTWIGDIIPVTQLRAPINIVPHFGASADNHLTLYNSNGAPSVGWEEYYF
ncbi:uncharacterized protein BJ212DRAFT_1444268 [Suillus subaureus]|uniref:DUF6830 domain-containing protein n=1 Tax=Suillus subaureus TaxID=48587 RepID=A0A9P7ELL6_9AGAM|nr:uncharacterized protein BJ212DRAFT_1444268 [Suillus subaureus]KAG1824393.1 hypothetical protein BJ212DRAFT_1444268 [Suillus subaureus]